MKAVLCKTFGPPESLVVEEVAHVGKDARVVTDGVLHSRAKRLAQPVAPLLAPLRCQTGQAGREMIVAGDDDSDGW